MVSFHMYKARAGWWNIPNSACTDSTFVTTAKATSLLGSRSKYRVAVLKNSLYPGLLDTPSNLNSPKTTAWKNNFFSCQIYFVKFLCENSYVVIRQELGHFISAWNPDNGVHKRVQKANHIRCSQDSFVFYSGIPGRV